MASRFLGQFLLEKGLITPRQLLLALEAQRGSAPPLGEIARDQGMLGVEQAERINAIQRRQDRRFGEVAQDLGLLDASQVNELLRLQQAGRRLFGEILVEQGAITPARLEKALEEHRRDRDEATGALALGVKDHPLGDILTAAIDTCSRLFPRMLKVPCMYSEIGTQALPSMETQAFVSITITGDRPFRVGLCAGTDAMQGMAVAFLGPPRQPVDDALALDAFGEILNVVMGYLVGLVLPTGAHYRAAPPLRALPPQPLPADALTVRLDSPLGPIGLVVAA